MYIDPWQWFRDFQWQAIRDGNRHHLRLPEIYRSGWHYLETAQYDEAIPVFKEGIALSKEMQMPAWEFFFESWVCEVNVLAFNYQEALDWTTRLVAKSVRPEYQEHPCRPVVYFTLAWVYFYLDATGYEDDIIQALDTLESGMPLDEETHHRSIFLRADIAFEKEDFATARTFNDRYLNLVEGNSYREASGYNLLRAMAYIEGDLASALSNTRLRGKTAREAKLLNSAVNSILWEGVILHYQGEEAKASAMIQRGISEYEALNLSRKSDYYHILAEYHTATGDYTQAMNLRDKQLKLAKQSGSLTSEFYCHLDRCYLLNRTGQSIIAELTSAENTARRSKKPDFFLQKLSPVRDGKTSRYSWQIS